MDSGRVYEVLHCAVIYSVKMPGSGVKAKMLLKLP